MEKQARKFFTDTIGPGGYLRAGARNKKIGSSTELSRALQRLDRRSSAVCMMNLTKLFGKKTLEIAGSTGELRCC